MGPSVDTPVWKPLGELLVEQSWITPADLEQALEEQERTGRKLGQIVVENGFISVEGLTKVLLEQCGIDMSTEEGFGSGLRDELARRGGRRGSEPVRFEFTAEQPPEKKRRKKEKEREQEPEPQTEPEQEPPRVQRSRRVRLGRNPNRKPLKRLEKLVQDFERQERELVETITSLRMMLRPLED
jgi:hypothetical protein